MPDTRLEHDLRRNASLTQAEKHEIRNLIKQSDGDVCKRFVNNYVGQDTRLGTGH